MDKLGRKSVNSAGKSAIKLVKLPSFKTNEDIASESREILQTFLWWGAQTCSPSYKRLKIFATLRSDIFTRLRRITFKLGNVTNFKVIFSVVSKDFP